MVLKKIVVEESIIFVVSDEPFAGAAEWSALALATARLQVRQLDSFVLKQGQKRAGVVFSNELLEL